MDAAGAGLKQMEYWGHSKTIAMLPDAIQLTFSSCTVLWMDKIHFAPAGMDEPTTYQLVDKNDEPTPKKQLVGMDEPPLQKHGYHRNHHIHWCLP